MQSAELSSGSINRIHSVARESEMLMPSVLTRALVLFYTANNDIDGISNVLEDIQTGMLVRILLGMLPTT